MGKINVVLDDGSVKTVDEEDYKLSRGQGHVGEAQDPGDAIDRKKEDDRREKARGLAGGATALATAALDTASFGLIGKALAAYNPEEGQYISDSRQEHPGMNFAGTMIGVALPGAAGIAASAGKAVKGVTGSAAVGRAVEGGMFGVGGHIAHTNVTGDPLSIEGLATDIGVGAALNLGIGMAADKLRAPKKITKGDFGATGDMKFEPVKGSNDAPFAKAARARAKLDAANEVDDGIAAVERDYEVVDPDTKATLAANKKMAADTAKEAKGQLKQMIDTLDETPTYGALQDAHAASRGAAEKFNRGIEADQKAYDAFASPKGAAKAIKDFEAVQSRLREVSTTAPVAEAEATAANAKVTEEGSDFGAKVKNRRTRKTGKAGTDHAEPTDLAPTEPAPEDSFGGKFGRGKADHAAPVMPADELQTTIKEMTAAKDQARKLVKAGDYEGAADVMESMQQKVNKWLPKEKIEFPLRPLETAVELPPQLPKKLSELGKMRPETVGKIAQGLDENGLATLNLLAKDLGIAPGETAADTLTEMHKQIRQTMYKPMRAASAAAEDEVVMLTDEVTPLADRDVFGVKGGHGEPGQVADQMRVLKSEARGDFGEVVDELVPVGDRPSSVIKNEGQYKAPADSLGKSEAWEAASAEVDAQRSMGNYQESKWVGQKGGVAKAKGSLLDGPIALAKTGVVMSAGRLADRAMGHGVAGVFARLFAGRGAEMALEQLEFSVGSAAITSKIGVRAKIAEAFNRFAKPAGDTLEFFGPVAGSLKAGFPSGQHDESNDPRQLAMNRAADLTNAQVTGPDTLYSVVKGIAGENGQVGLKLHQQWMAVIGYLNAIAPKDPGTNLTMNGSRYLPTFDEANTFAHQWQAAMFPDAYIARTLAGHGHSAGIETLQMLYSAHLQEARDVAIMQDWQGVTAQGHAGLSMLFQRPMSALQDPNVFWVIQGQQLPQPIQQAQQNTRPPTGNPAGRPPAVNNKVAGSSVSALINQG